MEIAISGYKSIGRVQMKLGRVTVLLGPPAAGKSNILEAVALAAYFDRFALYGEVEPLGKLVRTDDVRGLSTYYDGTKTIQIAADGGEWRRSLRMHLQRGLRLEINDADVPVEAADGRRYLFLHNGLKYRTDASRVEFDGHVAAKLYGFDRFRSDVVESMVGGAAAEAPQDLLREDGRNFGAVAKRHPEVLRDVNAELKELGQVEATLLDDGRVVTSDGHVVAERPPDSLLRVLYVLTGLSSLTSSARLRGMEGRAIALLEEPEAHPRLLHLLAKHVEQFSEVGYAVITTHSPLLISLLRDRMDVTLYYVYRGCTGLTEAAELDKDAMAEEFVTAEDILFMKPREALRFRR
jgi:hypothetical protein